MAKQIVTVEGESIAGKVGHWMEFGCKDSTQGWFSGTETVKIESPELFEHIRKRLGGYGKVGWRVKIIFNFES